MLRPNSLPFALLLCSVILTSCDNHSSITATQEIPTQSGLVTGISAKDSSITIYKGIPFAAPPVGDLRWKAPKPPVAWAGVLKADTFCKSCIQNLNRSQLPWTEEYMIQNDTSENCLYLNIWTSAKKSDDNLPVLVFIHGGAFTGGSGAITVYDGEQLAKKGVIVVTINYRTGVMGFLAHPALTAESPTHTSGNYGLLDQVAALTWVKRNIINFGGDPDNVTISGQSAGASSVYLLTASPLAHGLFQSAIAESGPWSRRTITPRLEDAEKMGARFMDSLGVTSLEELRALPAGEVFARSRGFSFRPIVDGNFLPDDVAAIYSRGQQNDVPLLTGLNADERSSRANYGKTTLEEYKQNAIQTYDSSSDAFLQLYPASSDSTAGEMQKQNWRDEGLANMNDWLSARARNSRTDAFAYYFTRVTPWPEHPEYGAFHSSEMPYVFGNQSLINRPWTNWDDQLSEMMSSYWVNFIKTGDPNGEGMRHWPSSSDSVMVFGDEVKEKPVLAPDKLMFYRDVFKKNIGL